MGDLKIEVFEYLTSTTFKYSNTQLLKSSRYLLQNTNNTPQPEQFTNNPSLNFTNYRIKIRKDAISFFTFESGYV